MSINLNNEDNNPSPSLTDFDEEKESESYLTKEEPNWYEKVFLFRYIRAFDKKFPYVEPTIYWCTLITFEIILVALLISNVAVSKTILNPLIIVASIFGGLIVLFFWKSRLNVMKYITNWEERGFINYHINFVCQIVHIVIFSIFLFIYNMGASDPFSATTCNSLLSVMLVLAIVNMLLWIESTLFPWYGNIYSKNNSPLGKKLISSQ